MTIEQHTPLLAKLEQHKRNLAEKTRRKAERKHLRRGWLKEKHADTHSGVNSEAYRAGYDLIFGKDKWAEMEEDVDVSEAGDNISNENPSDSDRTAEHVAHQDSAEVSARGP